MNADVANVAAGDIVGVQNDEAIDLYRKVDNAFVFQATFSNAVPSTTVDVECDHEYEITGETGHEYGIAVEDQQMLLKKIQGQTKRASKNLFLPTFTRTANSNLVLTYNKETGELHIAGTPTDDYVQLDGGITNLVLDPNKNYVFMRNYN